MKILVVCMGNICRSPMAEIILNSKVALHKKEWIVESAGTIGFHQGEQADIRAIETCRRFGLDLSKHRARQFKTDDFSYFDHILVMDKTNFHDVQLKAKSSDEKRKVKFFTHLYKTSPNKEIPDPYYGGVKGFEQVFSLLDEAADDLVSYL